MKGIKIYFYWEDHLPLHFYVLFAGHDVMIDIEMLEPISGGFPKRQLKIVLKWAACHQDELADNWRLAQANEQPCQIPPTL